MRQLHMEKTIVYIRYHYISIEKIYFRFCTYIDTMDYLINNFKIIVSIKLPALHRSQVILKLINISRFIPSISHTRYLFMNRNQ